MLHREIIAVCSQIHIKHINKLCGQNVEFFYLKPGGKNSDHWAVNVIVQHTVIETAINAQNCATSHHLISGTVNLVIKQEYVSIQLHASGRTNLTLRVKEHALSLTNQSS